MKTVLIIVSVVLLAVACALGGFLFYNRSRAITIDLPPEQLKQSSVDSRWIRITVLGAGKVRVGEEEMSVAEMERRWVAEQWKAEPGVSIVSYYTTPYNEAIEVLDAVRRVGVERIDIRTERQEMKTAEPGATDNPDDAQRLREDH